MSTVSARVAVAGVEVAGELLSGLLRIPSVSGAEAALVEFVAAWCRAEGMEVEVWQAEEGELEGYAAARLRHLPLAGRPTMVARVKGSGRGKSLIFNAHSDVVPAGDVAKWRHDPWGGVVEDGKAFGRGACDVKGPLVSAMLAMKALVAAPAAGDVLLELIPGEEDCVGLGTLTSVVRGYRADGCVVLEPTEGEPRCASRGGVRFEVAVGGRSVHGTVKWLGEDAIAKVPGLLAALSETERALGERETDVLFAGYPFVRPVTVDSIRGGEWQGMVCERCTVAGYFELLPGDAVEDWTARFEAELRGRMGGAGEVQVMWGETYSGHRTAPGSELCLAAERAGGAMGKVAWAGFNSGCEAGLRAGLQGTPTLVWGPGSLAQAHAADEFVVLEDVRLAAERFAAFAQEWCQVQVKGSVL